MNHGGLKNVTEPTRLENKRERRRGAAGRAAALRRAPSDSDCSGETASLSADSGDRAPRPPPQPLRSGKTRSRRRGSEWEVLEGLKDGQRFEKRPDVFNGYLHKKRKWPLKGWHKRFFVIDGGILVYARSPTDVARGRLHGSVDVGLSVISAKARRRRIDIDADEFIYHLRAKTPEVFRTWLNVLKTHRLYRQHLLTFGARESVPKIHAPLDDLPPTDTSSRTSSCSPLSSSSENYQSDNLLSDKTDQNSTFNNRHKLVIQHSSSRSKTYLNAEGDNPCAGRTCEKQTSLCSMNCVSRRFDKRDLERRKSPNIVPEQSFNISLGSTLAESQIHSTDLDANSLKTNNNLDTRDSSNAQCDYPSNPNLVKQMFLDNKVNETQAYYFFTRKKSRSLSPINSMRRSKKSTNLVKYRNFFDEPPLKRPISKCMLLGYRTTNYHPVVNHEVACSTLLDKESNQIQVAICTQGKKNKTFQDAMTTSDYDDITQRLILSLIKSKHRHFETEEYIKLVIRELYDSKLDHDHPVKHLFRSLLEYWLKNTSIGPIRKNMTRTQSISRQSNEYFTKDQNISNIVIDTGNKETQFHGTSDDIKYIHPILKNPINKIPKADPKDSLYDCLSPRRDTESFEKERRIQELETLLKNTVYIFETTGNTAPSKEKDIKITKTLINNIGKLSDEFKKDTSNSSIEKIQDTINHLISETSISADIAKGFLSVYLDVLLHGDTSLTNTSSQSSSSKLEPHCEVQTESIIKKVSRSVTTLIRENNKPTENLDPGQLYLKDILDKVTTIFCRTKKTSDKKSDSEKSQNESQDDSIKNKKQAELGSPVKDYFEKKLIYENTDEKSIVIDLSKYDLEHISMVSDPAIKGLMSITIKLKEKPMDIGESNRKQLKLEFSETSDKDVKKDKWLKYIPTNSTNSNDLFQKELKRKSMLEIPKEFGLKPYLSSTDKTIKGCRVIHESEHSLDLSFNSSNALHKEYYDNDDQQSCYIMSFRKEPMATKFQPKKRVKVKDKNGVVLPKIETNQISPASVFEKPAPRVIDEKFILLLLENLTLLSKNVPSLYKDINTLYLKLKKKHEKVMKTCANIQGLNFLGKIYNEDSCTSNIKEVSTQWDTSTPTNNSEVDTKDKSTNTISVKFADKKNVLDQRLSPVNLKTISHSESQTIGDFDKGTDSEIIPKNLKTQATDFFESNSVKLEAEHIIQNRFKLISTRERAMSTAIKRVLDSETTHNYHFQAENKYEREIRKKKLLPKSRQDKIKEISLLPPLFKVSNQSQTDKIYVKFLKDKVGEREYNVYHLYVSKRFTNTLSSSISESTLDLKQSDDMKTLYRCSSGPSFVSGLLSPTAPPIRGPQAGFVSGTPGGRLASWIIESGGPLENASRELGQAQLSVQQLQRLLDALELQQQLHHDTDVSLEGASPNVKKDRRKFGLRKKKSNSKCSSVELQPPHMDPSGSHMALSALTAPPSPGGGASSMPNSAASLPIACAAARPQSLPGAETLTTAAGPASLTSLTPDHQLREDFTVLAKDLVASLKTIVSTLVCERGRLRAAMDAADTTTSPGGAVMAALRTNLSTALHQNSELRTRLSRIHDVSDLAEISSMGANSDPVNNRPFQQSLSYSSSCVSASEFFDAEGNDDEFKPAEIITADEAGVIELDGDSSSEAGSLSSEEGSASSDNSDGAIVSAEQVTLRAADPGAGWSRRVRLPSPRPTPGGPSLWNLLYKNIGKDLSQISMPVTINEPLNMLQRLCEELEYSELLDLAAECSGAVERMSLIAAFAVSAYSATAHRAASKPFNPLLAETYECVRDDRGFRFIAEQVSHHPPISACHAESSRWCFWQEARIKTKFWGKSMEFQPTGRVHVKLLTTGDHYSWNKVTTCVHNLFGGQRWVDQYGDMHITCHGTEITCKLNFIKASSWSSSRHEVRGAVSGGGARLRLAGRWSEALYAGDPPAARCLWRPGATPPEHELFYGFTRFAMELNELEPGMRDTLPHTDTRLRPDQRALEEGDVEAAEQLKHRLEQAQRERRRDNAPHAPAWFRKTMESGEEMWVFSGEYWKAREAGFCDNLAPAIW